MASEVSGIYCVRCGAHCDEGDAFCRRCGAPTPTTQGPPLPQVSPRVNSESPGLGTEQVASSAPGAWTGATPSSPARRLALTGLAIVVIGIAGVILLAMNGKPGSVGAGLGLAPVTHTVKGTFTLTDTDVPSSISSAGGTCYGTGGYSDMKPGASVLLKDESGTVLSSTTLGIGIGGGSMCIFTFTLQNVPDTAKFYVVSVSHRGEVSNSHAEMDADGWTYSLSMGD